MIYNSIYMGHVFFGQTVFARLLSLFEKHMPYRAVRACAWLQTAPSPAPVLTYEGSNFVPTKQICAKLFHVFGQNVPKFSENFIPKLVN